MNKMMSTILESSALVTATVEARREGYYTLKSGHIRFRAKKALSCMVQPSVGDKVMTCSMDETHYIVSVLESEVPTTVAIVADTIRLDAQQSIETFSPKANVVISDMSFLGGVLAIKAQSVAFVSSVYNGIVERVTLRHKEVHQMVEGHIEQQMHSSRRVVKGCDIHQVEESITFSEGAVKIDAEQVNIA